MARVQAEWAVPDLGLRNDDGTTGIFAWLGWGSTIGEEGSGAGCGGGCGSPQPGPKSHAAEGGNRAGEAEHSRRGLWREGRWDDQRHARYPDCAGPLRRSWRRRSAGARGAVSDWIDSA